MVGLIGYTGTVGAHIAEQYNIDKFYNSKNIDSIIFVFPWAFSP